MNDLLSKIYDKSWLIQNIYTHHVDNVPSGIRTIVYQGLGECKQFKIVSTAFAANVILDDIKAHVREQSVRDIAREFEQSKITAYEDSDNIKSLGYEFTRNHAIFCNEKHYAWLLQNWAKLNIQLIKNHRFTPLHESIAPYAVAFLGAWPVYIIETDSAYLVDLHRSAIVNPNVDVQVTENQDDTMKIETIFSGYVCINAIKLNQFDITD